MAVRKYKMDLPNTFSDNESATWNEPQNRATFTGKMRFASGNLIFMKGKKDLHDFCSQQVTVIFWNIYQCVSLFKVHESMKTAQMLPLEWRISLVTLTKLKAHKDQSFLTIRSNAEFGNLRIIRFFIFISRITFTVRWTSSVNIRDSQLLDRYCQCRQTKRQ